ncbi:MAG: hypothetical protein ACHP84_00790 [Caulobacterales bacterium]
MAITSYGTITNEDVEKFKRHIERQRKTVTPARARERLIESGALRRDGSPYSPETKGEESGPPAHVNGRK